MGVSLNNGATEMGGHQRKQQNLVLFAYRETIAHFAWISVFVRFELNVNVWVFRMQVILTGN